MDIIRQYFPIKVPKRDVTSLLIAIAIYLVGGAVIGLLIGVLSGIPLVNILMWIVGLILELYVLVGIALALLDFLGIKLK